MANMVVEPVRPPVLYTNNQRFSVQASSGRDVEPTLVPAGAAGDGMAFYSKIA